MQHLFAIGSLTPIGRTFNKDLLNKDLLPAFYFINRFEAQENLLKYGSVTQAVGLQSI